MIQSNRTERLAVGKHDTVGDHRRWPLNSDFRSGKAAQCIAATKSCEPPN